MFPDTVVPLISRCACAAAASLALALAPALAWAQTPAAAPVPCTRIMEAQPDAMPMELEGGVIYVQVKPKVKAAVAAALPKVHPLLVQVQPCDQIAGWARSWDWDEANEAFTELAAAAAEEEHKLTLAQPKGSFLGVDVCEVDHDRVQSLKLKEERGVEITRVQEDTPAAKAGLKAHDVVLEFAGQRVEGTEQFVRLVRETPAGREVKIVISREGQQQTITATVGARKLGVTLLTPEAPQGGWRMPEMPAMPDLPRTFMSWRSPYMGIEAESLSPQLAEFFGVKQGVLVRAVQTGTPAEKAGIKAGDVITKVDGESVTSATEITSTIRSIRNKKTFPVTLVREKRETTVNVTIDQDGSSGWNMRAPATTRRISVSNRKI